MDKTPLSELALAMFEDLKLKTWRRRFDRDDLPVLVRTGTGEQARIVLPLEAIYLRIRN